MKALSLITAGHLPVTGESHPLRQESLRWLTAGNTIALAAVMLAFGGWYVWSQSNRSVEVTTVPRVVNEIPEFSTPQRIDPRPPAEPRPIMPASAPDFGVVEPVDRDVAEDFATNEEWSKVLDGDGRTFDGPVDAPAFNPTDMDTFVAFDELPVLLSIHRPIYPDLARQAGIDGTVLVKVLITRAGKVKEAVAVDGPEVLRNAAADAAKTGLFKPALQGMNPVEVWVLIPVTFSLNR